MIRRTRTIGRVYCVSARTSADNIREPFMLLIHTLCQLSPSMERRLSSQFILFCSYPQTRLINHDIPVGVQLLSPVT
jgi:hypothetical protein